MVSVDKLFILFQNQYVDFIKKIQSNLSEEQYNNMKEYYSQKTDIESTQTNQ